MSRCASKCSTAIGPWSRCSERSSGSAMVWSPPRVISLVPSAAQLVGGALDGGDRLVEVERVDRDVAGVGHLLHGERLDVQPRVVGPQQLGRGADVRRARTGRRGGRTPRSRTGCRPRRRRCAAPGRCAAGGRRWRGRRSAARWWRRPVRSGSAASCVESPALGGQRYRRYVDQTCRNRPDRRQSTRGSVLTVAELVADPELRLAAGRRPRPRSTGRSRPPRSPSWPSPARGCRAASCCSPSGCCCRAPSTAARPTSPGWTPPGCAPSGWGWAPTCRYQGAPAQLVAAADEVGMPLLTVPDPVPFIAVTKAVFAYRARAERRQLEWALQTQRALTAAAVSPGRPARHPGRAPARPPAGPAVVIDLLGRVLAESGPGGRAAGAASWPSCSTRCARRAWPPRRVDIADGRRRELHPLGARRLRAWLLVDGPAELRGRAPAVRRPGLAAVAGAGTPARAGRGAAPGPGAGAGPAGPGHGGRRGRGPLAGRGRAGRRRPAGRRGRRAGRRRRSWPPTCSSRCRTRWSGWSATWSSWPCRWAPTCRGCWPRWPPAARPGSGSGCGRGRWPCRCGRPARRCRPAGSQGRHVHAGEIASSRLLLAAVGAPALQAYADAVLGPLDATRPGRRAGARADRVPGAQRALGRGRRRAAACTGTPCGTGSTRCSGSPAAAWTRRRTGTSCGSPCAPGSPPAPPRSSSRHTGSDPATPMATPCDRATRVGRERRVTMARCPCSGRPR